tara:strand:+ start:579 stop:704 length:126 start_codon:yes stop_codon:yes gene_type:complete
MKVYQNLFCIIHLENVMVYGISIIIEQSLIYKLNIKQRNNL